MTDDRTLPAPTANGAGRVSTLDQLADIPEEEIWLQKQKSARTRRAYRLDVQHFMRTLAITTAAELRRADHKAVIAWERHTGSRHRQPFAGRAAGARQSRRRGRLP
jgi:integrase/recombinase XerD